MLRYPGAALAFRRSSVRTGAMPYMSLKSMLGEDGLKRLFYGVEGNFSDLLYLCPDVFSDRVENNKVALKEQKDVANDYRDQLGGLFQAVGSLKERAYIKDYWLVVTPNVCDSGLLAFDRPLKRNNFIVTSFNCEDIDLAVMIVMLSGMAAGTHKVSNVPSKRLATNSRLDVYVAVQLNSDCSIFPGCNGEVGNAGEYANPVFSLSLTVGQDAASYSDVPLRAFLQYGTNEVFGKSQPVYVEQYFDRNASETNGFNLGPGYIRGVLRELNRYHLQKYIAFNDLFASTGVEFCSYGLSLDELIEFESSFSKDPWAAMESPE